MRLPLPHPRSTRPHLLILVGCALAVGIFAIDTFTPLGIAVAVFYVIVVLMAARVLPSRGLLLVSAACIALTAISYLVQHGETYGPGLFRALAGLAAIGVTTVLALQNQAAEIELRRRADLLDVSHDAIFVRDANDVITFWNEGAKGLYGWSSGEALGRTSHELLKTVSPAPIEEIMAVVLRTGRWEGELIHTKRDGSRITVASRWSAQRDDRGRLVAILETNNDITDQKAAEERLQRAQAELAHVGRVSTLGALTASIAHEVNQPLAAIVTNGEVGLRWLDRDEPDLDEVRAAVSDMVAAAIRASEVIQRLRLLYKKSTPQKARLDLNSLLEGAVALTQSALRSQGMSVRLEPTPSLPRISGDPVQLQQVLVNLVVNGMEAIAAADNDRRELVIRSRQDRARFVTIDVEDSGGGIAPADMERVFDEFFTTKADGMGMGLSICRSIIENHGGELWVSKSSDRGTTFSFSLPLDGTGQP